MKKNNSGITMIALVLTIVILVIIASLVLNEGKEIIDESRMQTLETNMLTIQAKAKGYAEEIDAKIWTETNKNAARNAEFTSVERAFTGPTTIANAEILEQVDNQITTNYVAYTVTGTALINMGLDEIKDEVYVVIFSVDNYKLMDVIYLEGADYKQRTYYSLSEIKQILESE